MSLRSIDLQVALPKVQEAGQGHRTQNQQDTNQQQFASQFQKQTEQQQKQVQNSPKSEGAQVRKEGRSSSQENKHDPKDDCHQLDGSAKDELTVAKDPNLGHSIDIRI